MESVPMSIDRHGAKLGGKGGGITVDGLLGRLNSV